MRFLPLVGIGTFLLISSAPMRAEEPFDFLTTPGKLPKEIVPLDYAIRIVPNLGKLSFAGTETVNLRVRKPARKIVLNALELEVSAASVDGKSLPKSAIKVDGNQELLTLSLPSDLSTGEHSLTLSFSGKINERGQGLFF